MKDIDEILLALTVDCDLLKIKLHALVQTLVEQKQDEFVQDIIDKHPHWHGKTQVLLSSYKNLIEELTVICGLLEIDMPNADEKFRCWARKFKNYNVKRNCLLMDSHNLEFGSDHL
jgi:hypothetical protein